MWAGLASKVICDHLGLGCKTGLPYVWNADRPAGAKSAGSIQKDSKALAWQVRTALGRDELVIVNERKWKWQIVKLVNVCAFPYSLHHCGLHRRSSSPSLAK